MIPEIEEVVDTFGTQRRVGYIATCPRCRERGNLEASTGAAIYLLSTHMERH